ncbi:MAG: RecQ family ATP-dependent DNA helicase [Salibacteraceae bacterium]
MELTPEECLKKYWGFDKFRPLQREIIESVCSGKDTLALLPTGGGKSLCYQIPALMNPGICLVVSPLIALMNDQVATLRQRNIKALSVTSEYNYRQIDYILDRCIYEDIKLLYLSPERLITDLARTRIAKMKVSLIAVDEAHCISEWGYDFRPSYTRIAEIRKTHPDTPVLALTASATKTVVEDIRQKLEFRKGANTYTQSFHRKNLAYFIQWNENKLGLTEQIAKKQKGSGIIYLRNRRGTERAARELNSRGIAATYYHAGLSAVDRQQRQDDWMRGRVKVMVATNAFGMGIDKPDVRYVIHYDIPDSIENYYQECGRAGRDGKHSFAVGIFTAKDIDRLKERLVSSFPSKAEIKRCYQALCNHLQLAIGSGKEEVYHFDLKRLCESFDIKPITFIHSMKLLERDGYLTYDDTPGQRSAIKFTASSEAVYNTRISDQKLAPLIETLLRSYTGLFDEYVQIDEWTLAKRIKTNKTRVVKMLRDLQKLELADYREAVGSQSVFFNEGRLDVKNIRLSDEHYYQRKKVVADKVDAIIHYTTTRSKCRSRLISEYFGETNAQECGICDVCISNKDQGEA